MTEERGSLLPMFGGLVVIAFIVLGLTVDIARLQLAYRNVAAVADLATEAGASAIDEASMHEGVVALDPVAAHDVTEQTAHELAPGTEIDVEAAQDVVCATVSTSVSTSALAFIGQRTVAVSVRSCAEPAIG